jgi:Flp pilus assembly protein TadD
MTELKKEVRNANADTARVLKELNISSYASPDGGVKFNTTLAENREKNTNSYLQSQLKKDKITEFGELTSQFTAQDWEGFQKLVSQSNIQDKELILSVLSMYKDPEQRESEIRNLSSVFEQLADEILPQLRYSRITASIDVIGKSDEQIKAYAANDASALNVEELLYAATLTDDNSERMSIYKKATELYSDDYRTWNDLGLTQYVAGDYSSAKSSFQKAASLNSNSSEASMNLGLIELLNKNYSKANQLFGSAAGVSELSDALGVYYLKQGDNAAAANAFGDSKSNNAALAQILTKDYSKAKTTLAGIANPDATTYYLSAILGARTNNESSVLSNLKQAINLDSSLASQAANDLEFSNFNITSLIK